MPHESAAVPAPVRKVEERMTPPKEWNAAQAGRRVELGQVLKASRELRRRISTTTAIPGGLRDRLERVPVELEALE